MSRWLLFGESRVEQSQSSAASERAGKVAGRRRHRLAVESLEERLTLTASLTGAAAGGIHAAAVNLLTQLTPPLGSGVSVTTVAVSTPQAQHGQTVTITSTVSAATPGGPAPTGNVTFFDGPAYIGTAPLVNGTATISNWNVFLVGFNSVKAAYWGDTNYAVSDSNPTNVQVSKTATTTTLSTVTGLTAVAFTATVAPAGPYAGTPTGVVAFYDGGNLVGSVLVVNGKATLTQAKNGSGNHSYTASYFGDSGFNPSATTAPTVQALATDGSAIGLTTKTFTNAKGSPTGLGLFAKVTDTRTHLAPTKGTVTFSLDGKVVRTVALSGGAASVFVPLKSFKGHKLTATYSGVSGVQSSTTTVTI